MAEAPRLIIQPNKYYHIYNRGNNRRTLFRDDADFLKFLSLLDKYLKPVGTLLSYALMDNHFHLTVLMKSVDEIPPNLLRKPHTLGNTFGHLQNAYARYFNIKYEAVSGLFENHFERIEVSDVEYFRQLVIYHHCNPEKHGVINNIRQYLWISYQEFSSPGAIPHVDVSLTITKFGGLAAFFRAHEENIPLARQDFEFGN